MLRRATQQRRFGQFRRFDYAYVDACIFNASDNALPASRFGDLWQ